MRCSAVTARRLIRLDASEVEAVLHSPDLPAFLQAMYGNEPNQWSEQLSGMERLRVITNVLTRMRFCAPDGSMDFDSAESAADAPPGLMPWFDLPGRAAANTTIAFGHWSTLGELNRPHLIALDTGCDCRAAACLCAREAGCACG